MPAFQVARPAEEARCSCPQEPALPPVPCISQGAHSGGLASSEFPCLTSLTPAGPQEAALRGAGVGLRVVLRALGWGVLFVLVHLNLESAVALKTWQLEVGTLGTAGLQPSIS